ncbi:MAG: hypothetical protein WBP72_07160 [Rhodocyclaceae bacterium]
MIDQPSGTLRRTGRKIVQPTRPDFKPVQCGIWRTPDLTEDLLRLGAVGLHLLQLFGLGAKAVMDLVQHRT